MESQEPSTVFENISQRVAFSYQRQLSGCVPFTPAGLSPGEEHKLRASQQELAAFFHAFYQCVYDHPETFGLPLTKDVCVDEGDSKERKQDVSKTVKKARDKMAYGIEYLYHVGQQGTLVEDQLRLDQDAYGSFFTKSPRVKQKLVRGMQAVGLTVSEQDSAMVFGNTHYPHMMPALKALAEACAQRENDRMAKLLFARCDYCALDADYNPDALELLRTALSPTELERAAELHHALLEMAYVPAVDVGGVHNWRIQYQGKRAIKTTPFFEYEYDERQKRQLAMRVKCASTNRLVPLLDQQPASLQQDFYRYAHNCGAPKCSWCKSRKALGPSVLEQAGDTKTICWWMQRRFTDLDDESVDLVKQYASLHEALAAA